MSRITVKTVASSMAPPDAYVLTIGLSACATGYGETLQLARAKRSEFQAMLAETGLADEELRRLHSGIESQYEQVQRDDKWQTVQVGYRYEEQLRLQLPIESEKMERLMEALTDCEAAPTVQLGYTLRQGMDALRAEAIRQAAAQAQADAATLADALGVQLGGLVEAKYAECGQGMPVLYAARGMSDSIAPKEITVQVEGTFTWETV